jgi:hypothetical protein
VNIKNWGLDGLDGALGAFWVLFIFISGFFRLLLFCSGDSFFPEG